VAFSGQRARALASGGDGEDGWRRQDGRREVAADDDDFGVEERYGRGEDFADAAPGVESEA